MTQWLTTLHTLVLVLCQCTLANMLRHARILQPPGLLHCYLFVTSLYT